MVAAQGNEHGPVADGVQDAVDDHMETVAEREPGYRVDQADVRSTWDTPLAQDDPAQVVLADLSDRRKVDQPAGAGWTWRTCS